MRANQSRTAASEVQLGANAFLGARVEQGLKGQSSPVGAARGGGLPVLHVLVVDEDDAVRNACLEIARSMGFVVTGTRDAEGARAILKHQKLDLILLEMKMRGGGALDLLEEVKTLYPETALIVMTAYATVSSAVEAMRGGAGDYLTKPFAMEELISILERAGQAKHFDLESRRLRERLRSQKGSGRLIGQSPEMEKLYRILSKVANSSHPVMILGESGTGKELVARSIHFNGSSAHKAFVPVDCGSLMPEMIESELFGSVKGAMPGTGRAKEGLLAAAEGGTVFLDEIVETPAGSAGEASAGIARADGETGWRKSKRADFGKSACGNQPGHRCDGGAGAVPQGSLFSVECGQSADSALAGSEGRSSGAGSVFPGARTAGDREESHTVRRRFAGAGGVRLAGECAGAGECD